MFKGLSVFVFVIFLSLLKGQASEADDVNAAIAHVNASLETAKNSLLGEDGETALAHIKAAYRTLRGNLGLLPNSIWNVRLQDPTFKPIDFNPIPIELTVDYHQKGIDDYLKKYEAAVQSLKDAEVELAQKNYQQSLKILLVMLKTLNDATEPLKSNPIFLYSQLKALGEEAKKNAESIGSGFDEIKSAEAQLKVLHDVKWSIIGVYKQHRRRHKTALSLEVEVKRLATWHATLVDAVKRATVNPIPEWKQTSSFDSSPSVNSVNSLINDISNASIPWDIANALIQDTHSRAGNIYESLPNPTPEDQADWQHHLDKLQAWEDMRAQRAARLERLNALGADWQQAVEALILHLSSIELGTSRHSPTAVGQSAWFDFNYMSSTPVEWPFDYSLSTNPPSSLLPGSQLLQSTPSPRPASALAGWESLTGYTANLRAAIGAYSKECRLAVASMTAREAHDLQSDAAKATAPFAVSILSGDEITRVRDNLISLRNEASDYESDLKAALSDFQGVADLLETAHAAAMACQNFATNNPVELPLPDSLSHLSVDLSGTTIPVEDMTLFDWDEIHQMLAAHIEEVELAVGAVESETSRLWDEAVRLETTLQADLDFNHELAKGTASIQSLQEKMDAFRSGYLGDGIPTYLYQSLRFIDDDMKAILLPIYQRDPATFPQLEESIRAHLDYIRSLDRVSRWLFADLVEETRVWTDPLIFSNFHYEGNVLWNVNRGGYSNPVGTGRLVFPENQPIAQMAADARWSTSTTRQRTEMEEAGYLTTDEIGRGLPKVAAWLAGRGSEEKDYRLEIASLDNLSPVAGSRIASRASFVVFDEDGDPAPDILVVLKALAEAGLSDDVSAVSDPDGLAVFAIPPLTTYTELPLTYSIGGKAVLSIPIPWSDDPDGDQLPTAWESRFGYDPRLDLEANADDDGDGLTTAEEFQLGTDPRRKDSDNDGVTDGDEALAGADPNNYREIPGGKPVYPPIPRLGLDWQKVAPGPEPNASQCSLVDLGDTWLAVFPVFNLDDRSTYNRTYTSEDLVNWTFREALKLERLEIVQHRNETYGIGRSAIYRWATDHWETISEETPWMGHFEYRLASWRGRLYASFFTSFFEGAERITRNDIWSTDDFQTWTRDYEDLDFITNRRAYALFVWKDSLVLGGGYEADGSAAHARDHYSDWRQLNEPGGLWQLASTFDGPPVQMHFNSSSHYSLAGDTLYLSGLVPRGNFLGAEAQVWSTGDGSTWKRVEDAPAGWPVVSGERGLYILGVSLYHSGYAFPVDSPAETTGPGVARPSRLAAGLQHVLALDSSDRLWGWGSNSGGGLGEPTSDAVPRPKLLDADHHWKCVTSAMNASLAVRKDGTLWAWGNPSNYALGLPEWNSPFARVQVGRDSNWHLVSTSGDHTLAIKEDGTLWAWGSNAFAVLGYDNQFNQDDFSLSPVQVSTDTDWEYCRATPSCSVGIKSDGSAWLWGTGRYESNTYTETPARITKTGTGLVTQFPRVLNVLQAGYPNASQGVLTEEGQFYLRAANHHGELGNGTTNDNYGEHVEPVPFTAWTAVAQSREGTIAGIRWNNTLWVWGRHPGGGAFSEDPDLLKPQQVGTDADWVEIVSGTSFFVARKTDGSLWTFGYCPGFVSGNGVQSVKGLEPHAVDIFDTPIQMNDDLDGNGMPDAWEIQVAGKTGMHAMADDDGDGVPNRMEWIAKTNPQDALSSLRLHIERGISGQLELTWPAAEDRSDLIYYSRDLREWRLYDLEGQDGLESNRLHPVNEAIDPGEPLFFRLTRGL